MWHKFPERCLAIIPLLTICLIDTFLIESDDSDHQIKVKNQQKRIRIRKTLFSVSNLNFVKYEKLDCARFHRCEDSMQIIIWYNKIGCGILWPVDHVIIQSSIRHY